MKKVLLCIPDLGTGGAEKFVVDLAKNLDKSIFDVTVAVTRRKIASIFEKELAEYNIPVIDLSGSGYLTMLRKQIAYLRREKPDVVHTNIGSVLHMMVATKVLGVPIKLLTMHNQPAHSLTGQKLYTLVYRTAFTFFGYKPVGICDHITKAVCEDFALPADKVYTVNNGVDITRFHAAEKATENAKIQIISTGGMRPVKNQAALLEAFYDLYQRNSNVHLTILGDGVLRPELEQKVEQLGLRDAVDMPGVKKDVCSYLQKADIYVSSSNSEGLPLSILEAMACGLPVVATAAGGTVDIVKTGINGIVVPLDDRAALAEALENMVNDAELRIKYGAESWRVAQQWSIEACTKGYEALYLGNA